jgi:hypothetical protein
MSAPLIPLKIMDGLLLLSDGVLVLSEMIELALYLDVIVDGLLKQ